MRFYVLTTIVSDPTEQAECCGCGKEMDRQRAVQSGWGYNDRGKWCSDCINYQQYLDRQYDEARERAMHDDPTGQDLDTFYGDN